MLDEGHETPASTVRDGHWDEILEMPSESPWPILLAVATLAAFAMFLVNHFVIGAMFAGAAGLALAAWHWKEPQQS